MNLLLRFIIVLLAALRRQPLRILDESMVTFQIWPNDLDINGHMNNGRYLTLMDLGRIDLMVRTGLAKVALRRKWHPVVGSATIRFRLPLRLFQIYQLKTRVLGWDEKWFYVEQRFERRGNVVAVGVVKGLLRGHTGNIPPAEVLRSINLAIPSPEMPPAIDLWQQSEAVLSQL